MDLRASYPETRGERLPSAIITPPSGITWLVVTILCGVLLSVLPVPVLAQASQQYTVRVNGNPVITVRPPVLVSGEWFVPLSPIARSLGADLKVDPTARSLRVIRSDGVTASYDVATGRILQGAVMTAQVTNFRQVQLNVGPENILFPLDGVVALFGVKAREDIDQRTLEIELAPLTADAGAGGGGPYFKVASLEDRYVMTTNGQVWQQTVDLRGQSLIGNNRLTGNLDLSGGAGGSLLTFRQGFVRLETPAGRAITAGDQGVSLGLDALNNTVRGLGYEWRWREFTVDVYGGQAASSISSALGSSGLASYDTVISGFGLHRKSKRFDFTVGANAFRGPLRRGTTAGAGFGGRYARNEFTLQGLVGDFSGTSLRPVLQVVDANAVLPGTVNPFLDAQGNAVEPGSVVQVEQPNGQVKGPAYGFSVVDTFTPFKSHILSLSALWERYSRNFLVVRDDSRFSAVSRESVSANLGPLRYLSFMGSLHESATLLGTPIPDRGYTYGANATTPGNTPVQLGYFRSVQTNGVSAPRFLLSQYSLQLPHVNRFAASATYAETEFAGSRSRTFVETFTAELNRYGRLGFHDQLQIASTHNYGIDWSQQFGTKGAYFTGGLERQTGPVLRPSFAPVVGFRIPLRHGQSVTVSYYSVRGSSLLSFEIGGTLIRRKEVATGNNAQTALVVPASLNGQVYHDVNLNSQFNSGVDRPLSQMTVWLDEQLSTTTDSGGYYKFDGIATGTHRVRVDTATLPARLIFATEDLKVAVMPYRANRQDFRAIPSGRIEGTVSIVKMDDAGTAQAKPYPDAHLFATGNRDTFSEGDGGFVLGDIPPGTYELKVDPTSIPAGFVARPEVRAVEVKPGQTTKSVEFRLVRPVIAKAAPPPTAPGVLEGNVWENRIGGKVPVPGVQIAIDGKTAATTDAEGHYQIPKVPAGTRQVSVATGELPQGLAPGAVDRAAVKVPSNDTARQDFEVFRLISLRGKVLIQEQAPMPSIIVKLTPAGVQSTCDANGEFHFDGLREGDYEVSADPKSLPEGAVAVGPDHVAVTLRVGQEPPVILLQFSVKPMKPQPQPKLPAAPSVKRPAAAAEIRESEPIPPTRKAPAGTFTRPTPS